MALTDDDTPEAGDQTGADALPNQALHEGDIDVATRFLLPAMDNAEFVRSDIEEGLETRHPLIEKLPAMDEDQCVSIPLRDHFRGNDGLAECRGRCEHPGFMREKGCGSFILFRRQLAEKASPDRPPLLAFVALLGNDARVAKKSQQIIKASPREGDMFREQLGTGDNARLAERRQPHALRPLQFVVLESP